MGKTKRNNLPFPGIIVEQKTDMLPHASRGNCRCLNGDAGHASHRSIIIVILLEEIRTFWIKMAEHSFSARFCRCKLARAQGFQKTNMPSTERSFYLLKTRTVCVIFSIIACSVLMALVFYYHDMLQKVTMQRTQHF